ncbi:MAG: hypothetical protein SOZ25_03905 [Prevotella sp.]|nr:hypothetical protein [Prevotella sp.]
MRKKIISALLLGLFTVASTSTFVSCKDYDDDISDLQGQVTSQNSALEALKTKVATAETAITSLESAQRTLEGKVDANATAATNAINAAKAELQSAIDAVKGTAANNAAELAKVDGKISNAIEQAKAEIQVALNLKADLADLQTAQNELTTVSNKLNTLSDKYTQFIGEYTSLKAALDAQKAVLGSAIASGDAETLNKAKAEVAALETKLNGAMNTLKTNLETEINGVAGKLTDLKTTVGELKAAHDGFATKDQYTALNNQLTTILNEKIPAVEQSVTALEKKVGKNINVISAALAKALRSLVFQPDLYVDGIEAFEYRFRVDTTLVETTVAGYTRAMRTGETAAHYIDNVTDYKHGTGSVTLVTPLVEKIMYHANPSTTDTKFENIKGFAVREAEVISRGENPVKFNAVEKLLDNKTQIFENTGGIITVGLQVAEADKGKFVDATGKVNDKASYIAALQAYSSLNGTTGEDTVITSDYAMLYPEKVWVEGLVWTDMTKKKANEFDETGVAQKKDLNVTEDMDHDGRPGKYSGCEEKCHVWDTPKEALKENPEDAVQLFYNDKTGIRLDQHLGIHVVRETKTKRAIPFSKPEKVNLTDVAKYGLKYEFELVNYLIDSNKTSDSKFCKLDSLTGNIIAQNVKADETAGEQSASSVNREPLVRVLLKDIKTGAVIKDGYILVHITKEAPGVDPENAKVVDLHTYTHMFDLCKGVTFDYTSYAEFNQYVLTDGLDNLEKVNFDAQYTIDAKSTSGEVSVVKHYTEPLAKADNSAKLNKVGTVYHRKNVDGTTNDAFYVEFTAAELEYLTHDGKLDKDGKVVYTTYARYKGNKGAGAKYDYLYIKLTVELTRASVGKFGIKTKNVDYWFGLDGNDAGLEAVVFNCNSPLNGKDIKSWSRSIADNFEGNKVLLTATADNSKFYFTPEQKKVVETDAVTGAKTTWIITPQPNATDGDYKSLVPVYYSSILSGMNVKHEWKSEADANEWINKCVIDYDKGVYANKTLYAYKNTVSGNGTKIATINQATGEVALDHNPTTERIINAIGYEAGHKNIDKQFRAQIGVIADKGCSVLQSEGATFLASWQRPINPAETHEVVRLDAKTNADTIFVADILKFYDFRGPEEGKMETAATKWLWAYYNIKSIEVDCTPENVYTNMGMLNDDDDDFKNLTKKLSAVNTNAKLYAYDVATDLEKKVGTATFDLRNLNGVNYNNANKSEALYKIFNGTNVEKAQFGYIIYYNNGANVTRFSVRIPVKVTYEWGTFKTYVTVAIHRTLGN